MHSIIRSALLALALLSQPSPAAETCPDSSGTVAISLKELIISYETGVQRGVFVVRNKGPSSLQLAGTFDAEGLVMDYPAARVQIQPVKGKWTDLAYPAGSFVTPPDLRRIAPGVETVVVVDMRSNEIPSTQARVILHGVGDQRCFASGAFRMVAAPRQDQVPLKK